MFRKYRVLKKKIKFRDGLVKLRDVQIERMGEFLESSSRRIDKTEKEMAERGHTIGSLHDRINMQNIHGKNARRTITEQNHAIALLRGESKDLRYKIIAREKDIEELLDYKAKYYNILKNMKL